MKKIGKGAIILAVIVIYFIVMGIKDSKTKNALSSKILKEVTIVSDGKIYPENEGKLVLVTGKITFDKSVKFNEIDYDFNTFKAERIVRDFVKKQDDKTPKWIERKSPITTQVENSFNTSPADNIDSIETENDLFKPAILPDNLFSLTLTTPAKIGDFNLDENGMSKFNTFGFIADKKLTPCGLEFGELYYTNPASVGADDPKEGDISLQYNFYDMKEDTVSILAKQSNNSFASYYIDNDSVYEVFSGNVNSIDALKKQLAGNTKSNFTQRMIFVVIILAVGLLLIKDSKKKNQNESESSSK